MLALSYTFLNIVAQKFKEEGIEILEANSSSYRLNITIKVVLGVFIEYIKFYPIKCVLQF